MKTRDRKAIWVQYRSYRLEAIQKGEGNERERWIAFSSDTATVIRNDEKTKDNPNGLGMVPEILIHTPGAMDLSRLEVGSVLKNHDVDQIIASIEELRAGEGVCRARIRFTSTADGVKAQSEVADGALKGVSFGYDPVEYERIGEGEEYRDEAGKVYRGPCVVVTRWVALELTLTPVPADATVGVGRTGSTGSKLPLPVPHKEKIMELREYVLTQCVKRGLSMAVAEAVLKKAKTNEDADALLGVAVLAGMAGRMAPKKKRALVTAGGGDDDDTETRAKKCDDEETRDDEADEEREEGDDDEETKACKAACEEDDTADDGVRKKGRAWKSSRSEHRQQTAAAGGTQVQVERERYRNIRLLARQFNLTDEERDEHIELGTTTDELMRALRKKQVTGAGERVISRGGRVEQGEDAAEKLVRCAESGLAHRVLPGLMAPFSERKWKNEGFTVSPGEEKSNPTKEYLDSFKDVGLGRRMSCEEIARMLLRAGGYRDWNSMNRVEAINELFTARFVNGMQVRMGGSAANSNASLANLFANVANKTLMREYKRREPTWKFWCRTGTLTDYKPMSLVRMSDVGDFLQKAENGAFFESAITDQAETIALDDYGRIYSLTNQMLINDDLDAFSRLSAKMQLAAIRLVSTLVYTKLLANPTMGADGVALFHATHGNLSTGLAFSEAEIVKMLKAFRVQTAYKSTLETKPADSLDIEPEILLIPPSLEIAAQKLFNPMMLYTGADVPFKGRYQIIVEPRLENASYTGYSALASYLMADPATADTFMVAFLDGDDQPRMNRVEDFEKLTIKFINWLPCAVKPVDWRAMVKSNGV